MSNTNIQYNLSLFKYMNLKDKETFFWECLKVLKYDKLLFGSFSREEIKERFDKDLTEEEYQYLKDNFEIEYRALEESIIIFIEDALYNRKEKAGNNG